MKIKNKFKLLITGTSLALGSVILGATLLSSCTTSAANPYAPYTWISSSTGTSSDSQFRFQTSANEISFFNNSSSTLLPDSYKGKYVTAADLKKEYISISRSRVDEILKDTNNWNQIKTLYGYTSTSNDNKTYESYSQKTKPNFFYGVSPTTQMVSLANLYNELNALSSIFKYASNFSREMLSYLATNTIHLLLKGETSSLIPEGDTSITNTKALEVLAAFGLSFGEGSNTYHLWPSGFTADITPVVTDTNKNATNSSSVMQPSLTQQGDINAPLNLATYDSSSKSLTYPSYKLEVKNIKINYQWYKADRVGGSYVSSINDVNNSLTNEQRENLRKLGISSGTLSHESYSVPLMDMLFNVNPERYEYQDPFYPGLYNNVSTGLYNVQPTQVYSPYGKNVDFINNTYPSQLQTTITNNQSINWRGIVTVSNNNQLSGTNLPNGLYDSISNKDLMTLPYYQRNLIFNSSTTIPPYELKDNTSTLTYFNVQQILTLFVDPYNKNSSYTNMVVYNNINDLSKNNYLNMWSLGWLQENLTNTTNITEVESYKNLKSALGFKNDSIKIDSFTSPSSQYYSTYSKGLSMYYRMIDLKDIVNGTNHTFN